MMTDVLSASDLQEEQLHYWHIGYFRALGFKRHQIEILELAGVQPHDAEDLLKLECPHELALEILT